MPRARREVFASHASGGKQHTKLVDEVVIPISAKQVLQYTEDSHGGEKKNVFYWRPPMSYLKGETSVTGVRGILLRVLKLVIGLKNMSSQDLHYELCMPGQNIKGEAKSFHEEGGRLDPAGNLSSVVEYSLNYDDMRQRGLKSRSIRTLIDGGDLLGDLDAEIIRLGELQLEVDSPEMLRGDAGEISLRVEYEVKNATATVKSELCFYSEYIEGGRAMGQLEESEKFALTQVNTALTNLPNEGYPQIGFDWIASAGSTSAVELAWFKLGAPAGQFRWRAMEDGDTRICIPSLCIVEISNEAGQQFYTALGNLEWGFDYNRGSWCLVQPDGSDGQWEVKVVSGWRRAVSSRVPVIVYDRRAPTLMGEGELRGLLGKLTAYLASTQEE